MKEKLKLVAYATKMNNVFNNSFKITVQKRTFFFLGLLLSIDKINLFLNNYKLDKNFFDEGLNEIDKVDFINRLIFEELEKKIKPSVLNKLRFIKTENIHISFEEYVSFLTDFVINLKDKKDDVVGIFYIEFLKYVQKAGGQDIVLTPEHVKGLMFDLVSLNENDVLVDLCVGSGGFLKEASNKCSSVGIEIDEDMYDISYLNLLLTGKENSLYKGNSLINFKTEDDDFIEDKIKELKPNISLMNPPYNDDAAIDFILRACELLNFSRENKRLVVLAPSSCLRKKIEKTKKVFEIAKLKTVVDMNGGLFVSQGINVKTSLFVFEIGVEHSGQTFFCDFKDDGYSYSKRKMEDTGDFQNLKLEILKNINDLNVVDGKTYQEEINLISFENTMYTPKKEFSLTNMDFVKSLVDYYIFELKECLHEK